MGKLVHMSEHKVQPKSESGVYKNTRYTLIFNPNANVTERWTYTIKYVKTYEYHGYASSIVEARTKVRQHIARLHGVTDRTA